jgi:type VI secretion system protein ImpF
MNGVNGKRRLSPPLMFAFRSAHEARDAKKKLDLRDETGERIIAGRRSAARAAITEPMLRKEVARDLEALMNTISLDSSIDMTRFDRARKSVLNYGFPDIAHRTIDETSVDDIRTEIIDVLRRYEPRLASGSIEAVRDTQVSPVELRIRFLVRADLSCEPLNVPIEFVAEVELDSGKIQINRL